GARTPQILVRQVENLLVVGVTVDGRHEAVLEAEAVHHDFDDGDETVGRAGRVGNDVMLGGIVLVVVHAHYDRDVLALGGGGDHDLLGARRQMLGRALLVGEASGALQEIGRASCRVRVLLWGGGVSVR